MQNTEYNVSLALANHGHIHQYIIHGSVYGIYSSTIKVGKNEFFDVTNVKH